MHLRPRLCLFDAEKRPVFGRSFSAENQTLREILSDGQVIGWIGLKKAKYLYNPLDVNILKQQVSVFYLIGFGIFLLAAIGSFFLARHMLTPIRQLAKGTRALSTLDFDARIDVRTDDELGQLSADFNRMAEKLKKYEEIRQQWITDISHELRTPLSIIRGEIEGMQDGVRVIDRKILDSVHSEVLRISKLVDDLHILSLADSQSLLLKKDPTKPLLILKEIVGVFENRFAQKEIDVHLEIKDEQEIVLLGDSDHLAQLYSNLLENTARHTDSPGTLKVYEFHDNDVLKICFEDSNPGVPDESLDRLFDRLYRVDKSRKRTLGGSGLGLTICKQIVESHGGTIGASNSSLGGLMITIEFPLLSTGLGSH